MSFGHAVMGLVLSVTRVFANVIRADDAGALESRFEHGGVARHGKLVEVLPRHARESVQHVALTLVVDDVVEEGAELGVHDLSAGVGGYLHDLVAIKLSGQRCARAVPTVEL